MRLSMEPPTLGRLASTGIHRSAHGPMPVQRPGRPQRRGSVGVPAKHRSMCVVTRCGSHGHGTDAHGMQVRQQAASPLPSPESPWVSPPQPVPCLPLPRPLPWAHWPRCTLGRRTGPCTPWMQSLGSRCPTPVPCVRRALSPLVIQVSSESNAWVPCPGQVWALKTGSWFSSRRARATVRYLDGQPTVQRWFWLPKHLLVQGPGGGSAGSNRVAVCHDGHVVQQGARRL
jgi:hypothetical protein